MSPGKFSMDSPAMAAAAGGVHTGRFLKLVPGQKAPLYIIRTADMTLAATGVTRVAMFLFSLPDLFKDALVPFVGPGLNNLSKGG